MLSVVALLPGCFSTSSTVKYDSETDFGSLKTYTWTDDATDAFQLGANAQQFVNAVNAGLEAKGFKSVPDNADFSIHIHPVESHRDAYKSVRGNVDFPKAVIRVEFANPKTGKPIWENATELYISEDAATQESKKAIDDAVATLMKEFPPTDLK